MSKVCQSGILCMGNGDINGISTFHQSESHNHYIKYLTLHRMNN